MKMCKPNDIQSVPVQKQAIPCQYLGKNCVREWKELLLVGKKVRTPRFVVDYRILNQQTGKKTVLIPNAD